MFNSLRLHQLASACRDSVIGIQSDQLAIHKKVGATEKQVEFFNDELVKHDENWTKVIGRMRKVWKNMKSEFAITRKQVQTLHQRVGLIEKAGGMHSGGGDMEEYYDDFDCMVRKVGVIEGALNELVDIVHAKIHNPNKLTKGGFNPDRMEELYRSLEERVNSQSTRIGRLERSKVNEHVEHFADGSKRLSSGGWK